MGRTITFFDSQSFAERLRMIGNIGCSVKLKESMVVISAYIEVIGRVLKDLAHICVRSHRIVTYHAADDSVSGISGDSGMIAREVGAVSVVIFSVCLVNAAVLKHAGGVDHLRDSVLIVCQAGHIVRQFYDSRALGIQILSRRHTAAECQVSGSVVIYHNRRVKHPGNSLYARSTSGNERLSVGISPGAYR